MKENLGTVKEDQAEMVKWQTEQAAATHRANQCMRDWTNKQLLERVCILEQKQQQQQQPQQQQQHQQQQQPQPCKKIKRIKRCMKQLSERLDVLENKRNDEPISWNPFDFKTIFDHYEDHDSHDNHDNDETECPALDLIANHYAEPLPLPLPLPCNNSNNDNNNSNDNNNDSNDSNDDMFEIIQIAPGSEFDFSLSFSLPK